MGLNLPVQILVWLCEDSCSTVLRFACADALSSLASDSTDVGLGIARAWLGDLLVHLTRNVKAHHSIRQVQAPCTHMPGCPGSGQRGLH